MLSAAKDPPLFRRGCEVVSEFLPGLPVLAVVETRAGKNASYGQKAHAGIFSEIATIASRVNVNSVPEHPSG
jgi:hypothetical protein